jgi:hypothetical protein
MLSVERLALPFQTAFARFEIGEQPVVRFPISFPQVIALIAPVLSFDEWQWQHHQNQDKE